MMKENDDYNFSNEEKKTLEELTKETIDMFNRLFIDKYADKYNNPSSLIDAYYSLAMAMWKNLYMSFLNGCIKSNVDRNILELNHPLVIETIVEATNEAFKVISIARNIH